MLSVNDHTIYRINYPIKLFKWYHSCQSWNGNTGEWQIWINNERIARGYYNLVGYITRLSLKVINILYLHKQRIDAIKDFFLFR